MEMSMKKLFLLLLIILFSISWVNAAVKKSPVKTKEKAKKHGLNIRYYLTDMNHNPTVNFITGESYYVYLSIQNTTQDSIIYQKPGDSEHLFHYIALKSLTEDMNPRFNNQNESLQIPIYATKDTVLISQGVIDDYQQIQFFKPGFYTIQIMPNVIFPDKYKNDWGKLEFEIECHENPDQVESDPFKDILNSDQLAPLIEEIEKLPELQNNGN